MTWKTNNGSISIADGRFKKSKKGDKAKFIKELDSYGFKGDKNKAWKQYTGTE